MIVCEAWLQIYKLTKCSELQLWTTMHSLVACILLLQLSTGWLQLGAYISPTSPWARGLCLSGGYVQLIVSKETNSLHFLVAGNRVLLLHASVLLQLPL